VAESTPASSFGSRPRHRSGTLTPIHGAVDLARAERAVAELLSALGVEGGRGAVEGTPARVARMYGELLAPGQFTPTTFPNEGDDGLVVVRDIAFASLCEHHLLPFSGIAHVGYLPGERIIGLSKIARAVEWCSRRLQVQERLTAEIADWMEETLAPRGVGVVLRASHLCMTVRGVRQPGATTTTTGFRGVLAGNFERRREFLAEVA
jgi:GTP cyclohydrolase I